MADLINVLDQKDTPDVDQETVVVGAAAAPEQEVPGTAADQEGATIYAGKYKSVEDLEKGYENLQKVQGQTGQKMDTIAQQNQQLIERLSAMEQAQQAAQQAAVQPEMPDFATMRTEIARKMDDGDLSFAEGLQQIRGIDAEEQQLIAQSQQQQILTAAEQKLQQELAARDEQAMVTAFHKDNPDFAGLQESGAFEQIKASNPYINDDYQAYLAYKAEKAFDEGKNAAVKEVAGSAPAAEVAANPGTAMKNETPAPRTRSATPAELLQSGLDAWNNAGG
jgi:hypothetical protein